MLSGYELIVIGVMLMLNAVFAAYEMALASITRARIHHLCDEKRKGAQDALFMKTRIEGSLAVIQLGITVVAAVAAATGGSGVEERFAPYIESAWSVPEPVAEVLALALLIAPLSLVTIVFAELVPKVIALNNREWMVLKLSPAMRVLFRVLNPVIAVIERIVKTITSIGNRRISSEVRNEKTESLQELRVAVSLARASRLLGRQEEKMVLAAAQLSSRPVREIMIPATDISTLYAGSTIAEAFIKAHLDMHTRFPVAARENDPQTIAGFVNFKDILSAMKTKPSDPTLRAILRPIKRVGGDTFLSPLLEMMIQQKMHIAIVADDDRVLGMITLEDILEELVGEIEDEFDSLPSYIQPYGNSWIIGGGAAMHVIAAALGLEWTQAANERPCSLTEWCSRKLGCHPKGGEIIEGDGLLVTPRKFRRKKMAEALVSVLEKK